MTIKFRDFLVNYDPTRDEYLQYRAQKRRRMGGSGGPVGESVLSDNNIVNEAVYIVSWGLGTDIQVKANSASDAISKAKKEILRKKPKLADPKYKDTWKKNPSITRISESVDPENDIDEALSMAQRRKAAQRFKKYKSRIKIGRERAARRVASKEVLMKRARKAARTAIMKKLIKDTPKSELDFARREQIEKRLDKMKPKIDQLAKKMLPKLRKAETERKRDSSKK